MKASALAFFISGALGSGVVINNHCNFKAYLTPVSGGTMGSTQTLAANGGSFSSAFQSSSTSLKLTKQQGSSSVLQFEYSLSGSNVAYDISIINSDPFSGNTVTLTPSGASSSSCSSINCNASGTCQSGTTATNSCPSSVTLTLVLCA